MEKGKKEGKEGRKEAIRDTERREEERKALLIGFAGSWLVLCGA
jgi:hypothetical protein